MYYHALSPTYSKQFSRDVFFHTFSQYFMLPESAVQVN